MGNTQAVGMAEAVADGSVSLDRALSYHLQTNHYPPLPNEVLPIAKHIIETQGEWGWDDAITLPEGMLYKGGSWAPVWACVQEWHLDAFLESFLMEE
ncbi:hypothetical protein LCGC14_0294670 [marine sediment metagenome]|uniref:Uncharacterized protein n=1 Tax=marine sediment metagenome TaxID=412755 RepID=A0A0F9TX04_9ZZZZ